MDTAEPKNATMLQRRSLETSHYAPPNRDTKFKCLFNEETFQHTVAIYINRQQFMLQLLLWRRLFTSALLAFDEPVPLLQHSHSAY